MFINKNFKNLSKLNQIKQLKIWINSLKDDDINRVILENRLNSLIDSSSNIKKYEKTSITFDVNH